MSQYRVKVIHFEVLNFIGYVYSQAWVNENQMSDQNYNPKYSKQ